MTAPEPGAVDGRHVPEALRPPAGVWGLRADRLDLAGRMLGPEADGVVRRSTLAGLVGARLAGLWEDVATDLRLRDGIALGAVGSLGRQDASPASDLDLLLVHDGRSHDAATVAAVAERLWYPIWDAGLDLDHSVRSLAQCRQVASANLP
ncbi:MAG: phosphohydrolase, partial [Actinotalea sp.]|nr:phosphohydrolase [Actinotalea sp.]